MNSVKESKTRAPQVLVLGMHRSGTSALAGLLERMGIHFGAEDQRMPALEQNPKGFNERLDVVALNNRILEAAGGDTLRVQHYCRNGLSSEDKEFFRPQIASLVDDLNQNSPWYIKDPRLCITLDRWLEVLTQPFAVVILRSPLAIARSLNKRGDCSTQTGLAVGEVYLKRLITLIQGVDHVVVQFQDLLHDPNRVAQCVATRLLECGYSGFESMPDFGDWIDPTLNHHDHDDQDFRDMATASQVELYSVLSSRTSLPAPGDYGISSSTWSILDDHEKYTSNLLINLQNAEAHGRQKEEACRFHEENVNKWMSAAEYHNQQSKSWEEAAAYHERQSKSWEEAAEYHNQQSKNWEEAAAYHERQSKSWEEAAAKCNLMNEELTSWIRELEAAKKYFLKEIEGYKYQLQSQDKAICKLTDELDLSRRELDTVIKQNNMLCMKLKLLNANRFVRLGSMLKMIPPAQLR
jgi:hypothetical protein